MGMSDLWHETNLVYFEMQEPEVQKYTLHRKYTAIFVV